MTSDTFDDIMNDEQLCRFWDLFNEAQALPLQERQEWFYVAIIFVTGVRMKEARDMRVEDMRVHPHPMILIPCGKGGKSRIVDVMPEFFPHYEAYVAELRGLRRRWAFRSAQSGRIPLSDKPPGLRTCREWWKRVIETCGVTYSRKMACHSGRRVFTNYIPRLPYPGAYGAPEYMSLRSLQDQLGHGSIETTAKYYFRAMPGHRFPSDQVFEWREHVCPVKGEEE